MFLSNDSKTCQDSDSESISVEPIGVQAAMLAPFSVPWPCTCCLLMLLCLLRLPLTFLQTACRIHGLGTSARHVSAYYCYPTWRRIGKKLLLLVVCLRFSKARIQKPDHEKQRLNGAREERFFTCLFSLKQSPITGKARGFGRIILLQV